jgi:hypothetical protein
MFRINLTKCEGFFSLPPPGRGRGRGPAKIMYPIVELDWFRMDHLLRHVN